MKKTDNYFPIKNSIKTVIFSMVLISFIALSCSSEDEEAPLVRDGGPFEISELTGSWEAIRANFYSVESSNNVDIVKQGGSLSLTVQSNGRCTFIVDPADREAITVSGEMFWSSYEGDEALAIVWDDSPDERSSFQTMWIFLTATNFQLGCSSECGEYDFNNNGTFEVCDLDFEFIRI